MKLHQVTGQNPYCGPAVLACIAHISTDEAAVALAEVRSTGICARGSAADHASATGDATITGVTSAELGVAMRRLGFTFDAWLDFESDPRPPRVEQIGDADYLRPGVFVVRCPGPPSHVLAMEYDGETTVVCDNTTGTVVAVADYASRRLPVARVWRVRPDHRFHDICARRLERKRARLLRETEEFLRTSRALAERAPVESVRTTPAP